MRETSMGLAIALVSSTALAVEDYDACLALVQSDAPRAEQEAGDWARFGGGAAARHCYALALLAIGAPLRAADEMIGAAVEEPGLTEVSRSDLLVQAGEVLVDEDDLLTAAVVAEQALRLTPQGPGALGLRGAVRVANGELPAAIRDLDLAIERGGPKPRWLLRRAAALRQRGQLVAARDDASFALELAPNDPVAWLEQGRIQAGLKEMAEARRALLRAIELDRNGEVGRAAQLAIQRMEAGLKP